MLCVGSLQIMHPYCFCFLRLYGQSVVKCWVICRQISQKCCVCITQTIWFLHVSFVCPSSRQLEHQRLYFCKDRSLIILCSISIFSSSRPFSIGVETSMSNCICWAFLRASSRVFMSFILSGSLTWWSNHATYHYTKRLPSILYKIWLSRSLNLLPYSRTISVGICLMSFNF